MLKAMSHVGVEKKLVKPFHLVDLLESLRMWKEPALLFGFEWLFRAVKGTAGHTGVQADIVTQAVIINCKQGLRFSSSSKCLFSVKRIEEP